MATLKFVYSTMNSGKSIDLLKTAHNYEEQKKTALLFTPAIDTRSGEGIISSRIGISKKATPIEEKTNIYHEVKKYKMYNNRRVDCVLIDEINFLTKEHIYQLTEIVDKLNVNVIAYGLKNTFDNKLFEGTEALLIYADEIEEIKTDCFYCSNKATMNMRLDENGKPITKGETIEVGGNDKYLPVCRHCYKKLTQRILN